MARPPATPRALAVARGEEPADLLIRGASVFSAGTREFVDTSLAIADGVIAGWGDRDALEVVNVDGAALTPGFVDAHMHLESTKLWIDEFIATVLPHGTTAVAADPHELANVLGIPGIVALMAAAVPMPFTFGIYASSCVPASSFEQSGAVLSAADLRELIERHGALGVAEVMNFPGVIAGDAEMLARIAAAGRARRVDGHSPGVSGRALDAYLAAGVESDHECTRLAEAEEKRRKGMWVFLRQGSASQNLLELAPSVIAHGPDLAAFCTDDREPDTLRTMGHVNDCARLAVAAGVDEIDALLLASTNPARYHGFAHLGNLGPGFQADVLCFSELGSWAPERVWQAGQLVAADGATVPEAVPPSPPPELLRCTVRIGEPPVAKALVKSVPDGTRVLAVGVESHSLTTLRREVTVGSDDVNFAAVVERHQATGRIGQGFATGFGLRRGAIGSTVAHDAHNVVVVGASGEDMAAAVARLAELGGGQVAVLDGKVLAEVPLPLAGLMSDRPATEVAEQIEALGAATAERLGATVEQPFMQLSFIALSVIPHMRLTDGGLLDVDGMAFVPVEVS